DAPALLERGATLPASSPTGRKPPVCAKPESDEEILTVQDAQLECVKAEIRAEADLARARAPQPRRDPPPRRKTPSQADPVAADRERIEYGIAELVGPQYVAFVEQAYRAILKREAD